MSKEDLLKIIEMANTPEAYEYADHIMDAYKKMDEMGYHEFAKLKFDYLMNRLDPVLKDIFEDYLLFDSECQRELEKLQILLFKVASSKETTEQNNKGYFEGGAT